MRLFLLCLAIGSAAVSFQQGWLDNAFVYWRSKAKGEDRAADAAALEGRMVTTVLAARRQAGLSMLAPDLQLQSWLLQRLSADAVDAESLVSDAQQACPRYFQMAVFKTSSASSSGLLEQTMKWSELNTRDHTHLAIVTAPGWFGIGWHATLLVGQRLPSFSPEALSDTGQDTFYTRCHLCGEGQACKIPRHSRSLSLECPHCRRVYAMLAADTHGRYRYVNEYLLGYSPPARFPIGQSKLDELMTIWRAVAGGCRYTLDGGSDNSDAWQTALETQSLGQGDCEDTSILLADWLLARNFEARVALGRYAERGGHAWVIVKVEGKDYLLESTEGASEAERPPLLEEVGSRYVPELLFDHLAFYTRRQAQSLWNGDFWGEATWQRVVPRDRSISVIKRGVLDR